MEDNGFFLRYRGVRGGYPKPGFTTTGYGGNTTCFEVRVGEHLVIVDAGTGIIELGREVARESSRAKIPIHCVIMFTHLHHDHTQGFPFFVPLLNPKANLYLYGVNPDYSKTLEDQIIGLCIPPVSPLGVERLRSCYHFHHIHTGDRLILREYGKIPEIRSYREMVTDVVDETAVIEVQHGKHHPKDGSTHYRINYKGKSLVIATDTEGFVDGDQELITFSRGADWLIHDAEYDEHEYGGNTIVRQGWGHSTWRMAVDVARAAGVKNLGLFHHNADHDDAFLDDMEKKAQAIFPNSFMAREGEILRII